jgi:oxygen-independent coproporphyrinogen-3 oxidase
MTFECAPRSVRPEFLASLREIGVTRLSMGVQSFDDELLRLNGRVHLAADVCRAFAAIRAAGFASVNLDLMAGLIGETEEKWQASIREAIALDPDSVTIYQTEIPHNTQLYREIKRGALPLPSGNKTGAARRRLSQLERADSRWWCLQCGARPRRHRFLYQDYLWYSATCSRSASRRSVTSAGCIIRMRPRSNAASGIDRGDLAFQRAYHLSERDRLVREFVLQLKLGAVAAAPFHARFGVELEDAFGAPLRECEAEGWLHFNADGVRLTRAGLLRVDQLLPRFYDPAHRDARYT